MSSTPDDLKYATTHEWVRGNDDGTLTVGITDHAQRRLGDVVFVELPEAGGTLEAGKECAVVESVKAAGDIYSPATGQVVAINDSLGDAPETVNQDPYGAGWLFKLKPKSDPQGLLDAQGYAALIQGEED